MNKQIEKTFEYMRRIDGSEFSPETVKNWYIARAYVLNKLKDVAIGPESNNHLHVVISGDSPLMLSVARQVALSAHYANFDEVSGRNRSVISIVSDNYDIADQLKKEEYLCNLPDYCKHTVFGSSPKNADSYIDIELRIERNRDVVDSNGIIIEMTEDDIHTFLKNTDENLLSIDTRKAVLAGRMYELGTLIDNLPDEDINSIKRYTLALDVFQHILLKRPISSLVDEETWSKDLIKVKNGLSIIFSADCFESRAKGIEQYCNNKKRRKEEAWAEIIEALSLSEHARWVAERLVMGYRPLNKQERIKDERLFGDVKKRYRDQLKKRQNDPTHIDLCSNADLRRINPNDMKYDCFIMLAIPMILKRIDITPTW
jgi:hypothetical protein